MRSRSDVLETAVLGLLNESPLHGYELRKRLNLVLGSFRAFSYGTLYPALKALVARGLIVTTESDPPPPPPRKTKPGIPGRTTKPKPLGRRRVVYELTAEGKEHLQTVLATAGPAAWEDDNFDVRFALFAQTDAETRLRVLEGRRTRLTERLEAFRESATHPRSRLDEYALELQRFGLEKVEREVLWLDSLISTERGRAAVQPRPSQQDQTKKERG
ncbi:PadR family transcriptional regulator [Promicromonospora iranensis]|uniref:DNA-binding PadR family transcriptional regulator n=1 Tax=Promicromonospora iranensis TaxID=1105144 RepID=A0ABU2CPA4_9MICO|nr:PadR family transcriptional regulator [Promicromonospora iranensis]MDR7383172.1 DNA-binding PadR family transcriptional regulator [Promicromonospora iranensis]